MFRVGIPTTDSANYRLLLGQANDNVGFSSAFVVTGTDSSRLRYRPSTDTLTVNISGNSSTSTLTDQINVANRPGSSGFAAEYLTFVRRNNTPANSETLHTSNGIYYNSTNFSLFCQGDITAFAGAASDDRLKENKSRIENPLDKIDSITGFTYTWNEKANDLGLTSKATQIGVSAQEVQKVLPEVVKTEQLENEDILIVKYEKMIPLLIEAIKEQNKKIEILEQKIKKLEG
jgi:hypothetical protein